MNVNLFINMQRDILSRKYAFSYPYINFVCTVRLKLLNWIWFGFLTRATMKIKLFWVLTHCSSGKVNWWSSETSVELTIKPCSSLWIHWPFQETWISADEVVLYFRISYSDFWIIQFNDQYLLRKNTDIYFQCYKVRIK